MMDEERKVEGVVEVIARAVFRAGFHPDEEQSHVDEKWIEWDDKRRLTLGMTANALKALTEAGFAIVPVTPIVGASDEGLNEAIAAMDDEPSRLVPLAYGGNSHWTSSSWSINPPPPFSSSIGR